MKFEVIKSNVTKGLDALTPQTSIEGANLTQTQKLQEREPAPDSAELLTAALFRCLSESRRHQQSVQEQFDLVLARLPENTTDISSLRHAIDRMEAVQQGLVAEMSSFRSTFVRIEQQIVQIFKTETNQVHNLEQVRLQGEGLARSFDKLSADFIARQVTDPLFKEFGRLYEKLLLLCALPAADAIREQIRGVVLRIVQFLEEQHIEIIHPAEGDRCEPRRHKVEAQQGTSTPGLHGHIIRVINVGLSSETHQIEAARVEAYKYERPQPSESVIKLNAQTYE